MSSDDVHFFFQLRDQVKLYHWQTHVYARHIATDGALEKLDKNIDMFVEVYMGKYGRPRMSAKNGTVVVHNLTEAGATRMIKAAVKHLQGPFTKKLDKEADSDLITIKDDIVGDLNQLLFLFTLH